MIHARDALHLPCATLSASDAGAARAILADVDAYVRQNMRRGGCAVPLDKSRFNEVIAAEVIRACQKKGWACALEQKFRQSEITGRPVEDAFVLSLVPGLDCYEDNTESPGSTLTGRPIEDVVLPLVPGLDCYEGSTKSPGGTP